MRTYKLLILGRHTPKHTWEFKDSQEIWEFLSISLLEEFKKLPHVTTNIIHVHHPKRDSDLDYSKLTEADCIIFSGLPTTFEQLDLVKLKEFTKYKKLVTFLERGLVSPGIDWAFEFKNEGKPNSTFIAGPINKKLYKTVEKEPKTILIDHEYRSAGICYELCLEAWLEPFKDEYKIFRLIRPDEKEPFISKFVTPIKETLLGEYLELTDKMETFIASHPESFGFANLDFIARGTRVLAPYNFLCQGIQNHFELKTFSNRDEFILRLKEPIDKAMLQKRIDKMTDYPQIVKIIDKKLRQFLLEADIIGIKNKLKEEELELEETKK